MMINWFLKHKWQVFFAVSAVCLAGAVFLHEREILELFYGLGLAGITILLSLVSGLWAYKGRAAGFFIILAGLAAFCSLVFIIDATTTQVSFRETCEARGQDYKFVTDSFDSEFVCEAPHEPDYAYTPMLTQGISAVLYWPYLALVVGNVLHAPYLLWRQVRQAIRKHKK